mgnify:CR=1 FL=1
MSDKPGIIATEPVAATTAVTAFLQAVMVVVAVFDIADLTGPQQAAIQGLVTSGWVLAGAFYARSRSVSKAALNQLGD